MVTDPDPARCCPFPIRVTVRTYWRKYDRKYLTTSGDELNSQEYSYVTGVVPLTAAVQNSLRPTIDKISWFATDDKSAVISVVGKNFFAGSSVLLGSNTYDTPANGLLIKSDHSLQVRTSIAALATGEGVLNGRYGPSIPLRVTLNNNTSAGVQINSFDFVLEPGHRLANLRLWLSHRGGQDLPLDGALKTVIGESYPIIAIQNVPVSGPYNFQQASCGVPTSSGTTANRQCVLIQAPVPADLVKGDVMVSIKFPFYGPNWQDSNVLGISTAEKKVTRLGGDKKTKIAISGSGFADKRSQKSSWKIQAAQRTIPCSPLPRPTQPGGIGNGVVKILRKVSNAGGFGCPPLRLHSKALRRSKEMRPAA